MRVTLFLIGMSLLLVTGCTNTVGDSSPNDENTLAPETEAGSSMRGSENKPGESQVTVVAPSGSVNLGEITPEKESAAGGELVEMPAPGVPNPQARMVAVTSHDLSRRLDVNPDEIQIESVEAVDWPDAAMGCPEPGMMYLQVITPGYQITLTAQGDSYTYHTDQAGRFVLCQSGVPEPPVE